MSDVLFGEVRALFAEVEAAQNRFPFWRRLTELLDMVDEETLRHVFIPYCRDHLSSWPDDERQLSRSWFNAIEEGESMVGMTLVRVYHGHQMRAEEIERLANTKDLDGLTVFSIRDNEWTIGARGGEAIANAPTMSNLEVLNLCNSGAGTGSAQAIAESPYLRKLRKLDLSDCYIGDNGLSALSNSQNMTHLNALSLPECSLTHVGVSALAKSPYFRQLKTLGLGRNQVGSSGVVHLADSPIINNLTSLSLWHNIGMGDGGGLALAHSRRLGRLNYLSLYLNDLTSVAGKALLSSVHLSELETLDLCHNHLDNTAFDDMTTESLPALKTLDLRLNKIGADGLTRLCAWPGLARLDQLWLNGNPLGEAGARVLAQCEALRQIEDVRVKDQDVTPDGVSVLAHCANVTISPY